MQQNFKMVATTLFGLEDILAEELKNLGAIDVQKANRSVAFVGDLGFMYKCNLALRTAIRILKFEKNFTARSEEEMYMKLKKINWSQIMDLEMTFAVKVVSHSRHFSNNTLFIALKAKDAIVDYFREKWDERPSVDTKHPDINLHIYIDNMECNVYLDSSGESLHKRGYRNMTNLAPINEVLAAGMVLLSGYNGTKHFIDPMCGSGTILIEAAMIASNIPANINRREFAFEKWKDFDLELFNIIVTSLMKKIVNPQYRIIGFDKAPSAIEKARENIKNANLDEFIKVSNEDFFKTRKEDEDAAVLVFNPPYGERLATKDIEMFYKNIGDTLKHNYPNTKVWFISSDFEALKYVGLKPSRKIPLKNGDLDCKFVNYEMYEGSKKLKFNS